jgi:nucleoside permease NupC
LAIFTQIEYINWYKKTLVLKNYFLEKIVKIAANRDSNIDPQIAAFSTLAPERRGDFARLAFRAYIAGSMACFLTACVAGSLIREK